MKKKIQQTWEEFWMKPASPRPLGVLRIGVAAVLLLQAWALAPQFFQLYGGNGILQGTLREVFGGSFLTDFTSLLEDLGIAETSTLSALAIAYLASLVALLLGYHSRVSATLAWALHWILCGGHITSYGLDTFASIFLFYLPWMPCGNALSLDCASGRTLNTPSADARWALRVVQLHLSIAYLFCGLDKAMGEQWWNGDAIWRSVMLPMYAQLDLHWLSRAPWLAKLAGWGTLVVEGGYPIGMWVPRLRKPWLAAIIGLHLGICFMMGLTLFALMMIVLSASAFGVGAEPAAQATRSTADVAEVKGWRLENRFLRRRVWGL